MTLKQNPKLWKVNFQLVPSEEYRQSSNIVTFCPSDAATSDSPAASGPETWGGHPSTAQKWCAGGFARAADPDRLTGRGARREFRPRSTINMESDSVKEFKLARAVCESAVTLTGDRDRRRLDKQRDACQAKRKTT
ncbi:unnamed protein product, partial [Iphiclides podalirius]